jgi:hypothetical protein
MKISKVIYKLKSIAKTLDFEGGEESVMALNIAIEILSETLKTEQLSAATQHVSAPIKGRRGNAPIGIVGIFKASAQKPNCDDKVKAA